MGTGSIPAGQGLSAQPVLPTAISVLATPTSVPAANPGIESMEVTARDARKISAKGAHPAQTCALCVTTTTGSIQGHASAALISTAGLAMLLSTYALLAILATVFRSMIPVLLAFPLTALAANLMPAPVPAAQIVLGSGMGNV